MYMFAKKKRKSKFEPRAKKAIFLGYSAQSKAYRLMNADTQEIMISRSVQFEENEMAMSPEGHTMTQTKPQQDWLMYPVANDAQRDDSADLDDNQDVFDEPEEIPDVDVEPEYLPIPEAAAEGAESPRDEVRRSERQTKEYHLQDWNFLPRKLGAR
uniref:Uncharacterized protein n=1 Tax=Sphaerodactylus townsendi TaxID=933632 RepID=A0ACB8FR04_9SAUR